MFHEDPFEFSRICRYPYAPALMMLAMAVALWVFDGGAFVLPTLLIAALSFVSTRHLVNQLRQADEQKNRLDQQLIQSQKLAALGELSSGIAHEINNPLAIVAQEVELICYLLKDDSPGHGSQPVSDVDESLQQITRQVNRCKEITHKLLDFARKKDPLIQDTDINRLIEDMVRLVEIETKQKDIVIERQYQKGLPVVRTDPPLMRQVILNLLNNAAYAVGRGGGITVATRLCPERDVEVRVSDTGCGIPREDLSRVFDPFYTTKPPGKGTGLGLSICHGIISRLGGRITVVSEVGKGTTFTVHLPLELEKGSSNGSDSEKAVCPGGG